MHIEEDDVAFVIRQIWSQLREVRSSRDSLKIGVLAPRCCGYIGALAAAGVIKQSVAFRLGELTHNAWTHALTDSRR
ncbi:MAG: hypothetical protein K2Y25_14880 [Pseudomonadaceae bacterium]|nr:hypothetical protein [Pseudomonadaceae bacterium]